MTKTVTGTVADTARLCERILGEVERVIVGKRQAVTTVLLGVLASGHILIEDLPGLGKTLLARTFATVLGLEFTRVQFTPDMLPADLTGAMVLDLATGEPAFRPGPVFTGLLLADEINRTPPKTQAALLEAMAEGQVSVDGVTRPLPSPFVVLATDNPIEYEGTYPLPEAQLDRFIARVSLGYLDAEGEAEMVRRRLAAGLGSWLGLCRRGPGRGRGTGGGVRGWRRGPALAVAAAVVACAFSRAGTAVLAAEGLLIVAYLIVADAPAGLSPKARPGSWLRQQAPAGVAGLIASGAVLAALALHQVSSAWLTAAGLAAAAVAYLIALPWARHR